MNINTNLIYFVPSLPCQKRFKNSVENVDAPS